jgi:hypothetical protein
MGPVGSRGFGMCPRIPTGDAVPSGARHPSTGALEEAEPLSCDRPTRALWFPTSCGSLVSDTFAAPHGRAAAVGGVLGLPRALPGSLRGYTHPEAGRMAHPV